MKLFTDDFILKTEEYSKVVFLNVNHWFSEGINYNCIK